MITRPCANGLGSGGSTISSGAGSLSMGMTALWAEAPAAGVLMSKFIAFFPLRFVSGLTTRTPARHPPGALAKDASARIDGQIGSATFPAMGNN
jgi:hypothetical protein